MSQVPPPPPVINYGSSITTPQRIGFGPRFGAALIDGLIMVPIFLLAVPMVVRLEQQNRMSPAVATVVAAGLALVGLAYTSMEIFRAATPGKMLLKLQICSADGTPAMQSQLVNRWLYKQMANILNLFATITGLQIIAGIANIYSLILLVGCFFVFGEAKQAFHDRWAKTAVFNRKQLETRGFEPLMAQPVAPPTQQG
jgi:uncharacterized RDD family membrane protein YckC